MTEKNPKIADLYPLIGNDIDQLSTFLLAKKALKLKKKLSLTKVCLKCKKEKLQIQFKTSNSKICMDCTALKIVTRTKREKTTRKIWQDKTGYKYIKMVVYGLKKLGLITQQPCEVCNDRNTLAHHDNYNEPWKVRWLCHNHHLDWHTKNTPIYVNK